ncbi:hypothetical protein COU80_03815 [Candidatus Peregrinibacteria bacterium CG10_big_fil_rev_8_21_14_0_10_55_24]|nr:MAG: hypothetical protein COU80_03815 [Candidatus Peregrinibacteria bacterium CG10_big_fil_rev_8_21_14_0_10_55_24]
MIPTLNHLRLLLRALFLGVLLALLTVSAVVLWVVLSFAGTNPTFPVDCAVVFGAAVHAQDSAGPGIDRRVRAAAELYRQNYITTLYFTGGKGSDYVESEASVMRKVAMLYGVAPEHIVLEEQASSTWENLAFSEPLLEGCTSVVGISDRYHLARIGLLSRMQGWEDLALYPAARQASVLFEVKSVLREAVAILYYLGMDVVK